MGLVLEIEFLTGVCRAAREPGDDAPDWPPQPDRVFSALVSAWAAGGERPEEREALEWLEAQPPPAVHASGHTARTTPDVFVPPNDPSASRAPKTYMNVMPSSRARRPRRFPIARPDRPLMAMAWSTEPELALFDALSAVTRRVATSGTRQAWSGADSCRPTPRSISVPLGSRTGASIRDACVNWRKPIAQILHGRRFALELRSSLKGHMIRLCWTMAGWPWKWSKARFPMSVRRLSFAACCATR